MNQPENNNVLALASEYVPCLYTPKSASRRSHLFKLLATDPGPNYHALYRVIDSPVTKPCVWRGNVLNASRNLSGLRQRECHDPRGMAFCVRQIIQSSPAMRLKTCVHAIRSDPDKVLHRGNLLTL